MKIRRSSYALAAIAAFAVEVAIALFAHDRFVRPYVGDSLAVVLVHLVLRAVTPVRTGAAVAMALTIAFAIEIGQLFGLVGALGLGANRVARIVLGGGFDPMDFIAYMAGAVGILAIEIGWGLESGSRTGRTGRDHHGCGGDSTAGRSSP